MIAISKYLPTLKAIVTGKFEMSRQFHIMSKVKDN